MLNFRTVKILVLSFLISTPVFAGFYIEYDPASTPANLIISRLAGDCKSLGACDKNEESGLRVNFFKATKSEYDLSGEEFKKVDPVAPAGFRVVDWTVQEINDKNTIDTVNADLALRASAKSEYESSSSIGQSKLCQLQVLAKENDILRKWTRDFMTEVSNSSSLNNFKTRIATLPTLNDRDDPLTTGTNEAITSFKNSVRQCIDDGDVNGL